MRSTLAPVRLIPQSSSTLRISSRRLMGASISIMIPMAFSIRLRV